MKRRSLLAATAAVAITFLALPALPSCSNGELPDYNYLGALRVLAIKAEPPEVSPGQSSTISPVVSDLNDGRTLTYGAVACVDPGVGYGAKADCGTNAVVLKAPGTAIPAVGTALKTYTGEAPTFTVSIPSTILDGRSAFDRFNGVAYLVLYTLTATKADGSTAQVTAYKRVLVTDATLRPIKNTNPTITSLTAKVGDTSRSLSSYLGALTFPPPSGEVPELAPVFSASSTETYPQLQASGVQATETERLVTTWFISSGSIRYYRTEQLNSNGWTPPQTHPTLADGTTSRGLLFVAVTRDGRGGEAYQIIEQ